MSQSYTTSIKSKLRFPLAVAPTPSLRADLAIAEARRGFLLALSQAFMATMWGVLWFGGSQKEVGDFSLVIFVGQVFFMMAVVLWSSSYGQYFGKPAFDCGFPRKMSGVEKAVLSAIVTVFLGGLLAPVIAYFEWKQGQKLEHLAAMLQSTLLIGTVLGAVFLALRASAVLRYAQGELRQAFSE